MGGAYVEMLDRIDGVLARRRSTADVASRDEVDGLYTDACAMILSLERERMELDRLLVELGDAEDEAAAIRQSRDLARRRGEVDRELESLRSLAAGLSTAADWVRDPAAGEVPRAETG